MFKQLLVVFGATGNQGGLFQAPSECSSIYSCSTGSVIKHVLDDPELSSRYDLRGITRDASSPKAKELASSGVEVVSADLDDPSTLPTALKGASFIYALTNTHYTNDTRVAETRQAKALCDEALKQGATYLIWSSMGHPFKISNGALTHAAHFDVKAEIEQYIRGQPIRSAFFAPGSFMQNYLTMQAPRPSPAGDGSYVLANICRPDTRVPLIDITDTGAWVGAILAEPDRYEGKFFAAAQGLYSMEEIAHIMSKVTGKTVRFQQMPDEVFKGLLPAPMRDMLFDMWLLFRDYGYYGESMEKDVEWAKAQAKGHLNDLEEFLTKTGFKLD